MLKFYITNSDNINILSNCVIKMLENVIVKGYNIILGDNHSNNLIQNLLLQKNYKNVTIYTSSIIANNIGGWEEKKIKLKSNNNILIETNIQEQLHKQREWQLVKDCNYAVIIYNSEFDNILYIINNLLKYKKQIMVINNKTNKSYIIETFEDFNKLFPKLNNNKTNNFNKFHQLQKIFK